MTAAILAFNRRTFASLHHRNYRLYFAGQVVSVTGTWMQNIAMAWLILELTHSPVAVGALALCQFLPFTVFGLFAGVLVDRLDARRLVIGTQAASMCTRNVGRWPPPCSRFPPAPSRAYASTATTGCTSPARSSR